MKAPHTILIVIIALMGAECLRAQSETETTLAASASARPGGASAGSPQGIAPKLDTDGRFWVYRNGPSHPRMPFAPYGWMSDITNNLAQIIHVELESNEHPNTAFRVSGATEKENCIQIKINWDNASWAGVAFISGPDKPPWWGESNRGRAYNLTALSKKKLVFYARGERGGEMIKIQLGVLSGKPYGDSLSKPFTSEELKLSTDWARQEVDLKAIAPSELARVCNGFGVIAEQGSQPGPGTETQVYIDDIYFE